MTGSYTTADESLTSEQRHDIQRQRLAADAEDAKWFRFIRVLLVFRGLTPLCYGIISMFAPAAMLEFGFWPNLTAPMGTMSGNDIAIGAVTNINAFWAGDDWQQSMAVYCAVRFGNEKLLWWIGAWAIPHNIYEIYLSQHFLSWCRDNPGAQCTTWGLWADFVLHIVLILATGSYLLIRRHLAFSRGADELARESTYLRL